MSMTSPKNFITWFKLYCSCDQSLVTLTFLWEKLSQPQFYKDLTRKTAFSERWSWFKFNYLGLALGTKWNIYTSVAKGLKRKVRKFWGLIRTFVEVTGEKRVRVAFLTPTSWIGLTIIESLGNPRHNINDQFFKWR